MDGMVFSQGQVTYPACEQSLRTLARGLHNRDLDKTDLSQVVLPHALRNLGYRTWGAGKWRDGTVPFSRAFTDTKSDISAIGRVGGSAAKVLGAVDKMTGSPWFIWLAPPMPHYPHDAPEPYRSMYANVDPDPLDLYTLEYGVAGTRAYYSMITWMDAFLGEILRGLDERGLRENTVVIYLTDNGAGLRQSKAAFREAGMRTPIIVRGPGVAPGTSPALVSSIDLYRTLIEWAGGTVPAQPDAESLLPLLRGESTDFRPLWFSNIKIDGDYAVRDVLGWKLYTNRSGTPKAVYDLTTDPFEEINLLNTPFGGNVIFQYLSELNTWRLRP